MSLTYTAYVSRNIIKYGGGALVAIVLSWSTVVAVIKAYKAAHPPYVSPTVRYGKLPKIIFPEKTFSAKKFVLELAGDNFPKLGDQAKVFVIYRPSSVVLALEEDKKTARAMGFVAEPVKISDGIYEFTNDSLNQSLMMNVLEGSFILKYPYLEDQMLLTSGGLPNGEGAIEGAKSFLQNAQKLRTDLLDGEKKVTFWGIEPDGLKSVPALSEANLVRVDLFRKNIEENFRVLSSDPSRAAVSVLVSGSTVTGKKIVEVNYKYVDIDRESFATYPIKPVETAWKELQAGNYWPAIDTGKEEVTIRNVSLAYFEPIKITDKANFLQPVYLFEGDNGFVAYIPAVVDKYLQE